MIPIIVIEGATATGKSQLAIELAHIFDTEIISSDSRQVYRYLDIGTAKPTLEERTDIKHHLVDIINPDENYNAGCFVKDATEIIKSLHSKGKIPIICGGTGLYVKALLEGLFKTDVNDAAVRSQLESELADKGLQHLYQELKSIDRNASETLSSNDKHRILRALEIYRVTGIPISEHWARQKREKLYNPYRILLDEERQTLYNRINSRILAMIKAGLIEEILSTLQEGYSWSNPGFNSLGYKEFRPYLENTDTLDNCVSLAMQNSRNYAKRQVTWYRKCIFSLTAQLSSITIKYIERLIEIHFASNMPEGT